MFQRAAEKRTDVREEEEEKSTDVREEKVPHASVSAPNPDDVNGASLQRSFFASRSRQTFSMDWDKPEAPNNGRGGGDFRDEPLSDDFDRSFSKNPENENPEEHEEDPKAEPSEEDLVSCEKCQRPIVVWDLPEHMDYHFAQELQDSFSGPSSSLPRPTLTPQARSKTKAKNQQTPRAKRARSEGGRTLESFFKKAP